MTTPASPKRPSLARAILLWALQTNPAWWASMRVWFFIWLGTLLLADPLLSLNSETFTGSAELVQTGAPGGWARPHTNQANASPGPRYRADVTIEQVRVGSRFATRVVVTDPFRVTDRSSAGALEPLTPEARREFFEALSTDKQGLAGGRIVYEAGPVTHVLNRTLWDTTAMPDLLRRGGGIDRPLVYYAVVWGRRLMFAAPFVILIIGLARAAQRVYFRRRVLLYAAGLCPRCGYPRADIVGPRCPECGCDTRREADDAIAALPESRALRARR